MRMPIAKWNTARDAWEIPGRIGLFCEHWDVYLGTFPTSGMTRNGEAYELPTWGVATADSGSLSSDGTQKLFMTPSAAEEVAGGPRDPDGGRQMRLSDQVREEAERGLLLPTPDVSSAQRSPESFAKGDHQISLQNIGDLLPTVRVQSADRDIIRREDYHSNLEEALGNLLLPTPNAQPSWGSRDPEVKKSEGRQINLADVTEHKLLPTTRAAMGETRNSNIYDRPGASNLENKVVSTGARMSQRSGPGSRSQAAQLPGQLSLADALEDSD